MKKYNENNTRLQAGVPPTQLSPHQPALSRLLNKNEVIVFFLKSRLKAGSDNLYIVPLIPRLKPGAKLMNPLLETDACH